MRPSRGSSKRRTWCFAEVSYCARYLFLCTRRLITGDLYRQYHSVASVCAGTLHISSPHTPTVCLHSCSLCAAYN